MHSKPAVFARNYPEYLKQAADLAQADPSRPVAFRSASVWKTAAEEVSQTGSIPIYFAEVGGSPEITYEADLIHVKLRPSWDDPETQKLVERSLPSTENEGLWQEYDSSVKSLFLVKRCRPLASRIPITMLVKLSDDTPISPEFRYSYSVVYEIGAEPETSQGWPTEVEDATKYWEGATREVTITVYERNSRAREACLSHHGYDCQVCGFNFEEAYGALGSEFIHVHHVVPLAQVGTDYKVDPIKDLVPLCPNCHMMVHKESPSLSVTQLQQIWSTHAG